jgi:uncharacterized protein YjbI with pentapeptide repeats
MQIGDFVKGKPESSSHYSITTEKMTKAVVKAAQGGQITIKILEHENGGMGTHTVTAEYFEVTGHQKPFNREEVLALLKDGCKKAILDYDLSDADLSGADLRRADLSDADLRRADLSDADLSGADLRRANLSGADLSGADLSGADLSDADLSGANLRRADLSDADLDFSCWPLWCGSLHVKTDKRLACQLAFHLCSMQCEDTEYIKMRNSILDFANQFHRVDECGRLEPVATELDQPLAEDIEEPYIDGIVLEHFGGRA